MSARFYLDKTELLCEETNIFLSLLVCCMICLTGLPAVCFSTQNSHEINIPGMRNQENWKSYLDLVTQTLSLSLSLPSVWIRAGLLAGWYVLSVPPSSSSSSLYTQRRHIKTALFAGLRIFRTKK